VSDASTTPGENSGETENGGEQEGGNGEGTESDTHEDPDGQNVNHDCPPNCDTQNGEQP
jgi:hypothetical protein